MLMRVLLVYPINVDFHAAKGIINKMHFQAEGFRALGLAPTVVCSSNRGVLVDGQLALRYPFGRSFASPINHRVLFWHLAQAATSRQDFRLVYVRYPLALPSFLWFLRTIRRRSPTVKVVVEIPTFPYRAEFTTVRQRVLAASDELLSPLLKRYVDRVVTFFGQDQIHGVPCIATTNGISVESVPVRHEPQAQPPSPEVRLLGVANLASWHGYDRVIRGMATVRGSPSGGVTFDIVGDGPERPALQSLAASLSLSDQVRFLGIRSGRALDASFDEADVAVGSMAMHRLALPMASSLKTREYCARGIPFTFAGADPDFPDGFPYARRVPEGEAPIDVGDVVAFARRMRAIPGHAQSMREYAKQHLTWERKLAPVARYLEVG